MSKPRLFPVATTRQEVPWEMHAEIQVGFMRLRRTVPSVSAISGEGMWCTRAPELRSQTQTSPATHSQLYYQKHVRSRQKMVPLPFPAQNTKLSLGPLKIPVVGFLRWDADLPAATVPTTASPTPSRGTTVVFPTPKCVLAPFLIAVVKSNVSPLPNLDLYPRSRSRTLNLATPTQPWSDL